MKSSLKKLTLIVPVALALILAGPFTSGYAAGKKGTGSKKAKAPSGPTERDKKLLGWTSNYPTSYAVNDQADIFFRGTIAEVKPVEGSKALEIRALPLEVLNNPMHYITLAHYKNGISVKITPSSSEKKLLKPGAVIEYNRYSKEVPSEAMGHARLISTENHLEFKPYDASPVVYLLKTNLEPEQYNNALQGALLYTGSIDKTDELKTRLETLAKNTNAELSQNAKKLLEKVK